MNTYPGGKHVTRTTSSSTHLFTVPEQNYINKTSPHDQMNVQTNLGTREKSATIKHRINSKAALRNCHKAAQ